MKSKILEILRKKDTYVSGQELSERFGVSRTAVWKAIHQLEEEGYRIEAVPRKGYHMVEIPDVVSKEEILSLLDTKWAGKNLICVESVDSTNNLAKQLAEQGAPEGTLVVADEQTGGKGRRGRSWCTPKGSAIAMTIVLRPDIRPELASMVTLVMGLSVAKAIESLYPVSVGIKWPNDVVVNGKKICGILTEMSAEMTGIHYLVIGTGINTNVEEFPEELQEVATSLIKELGEKVNRAELIAACLKYFEDYYEKYVAAGNLAPLKEDYEALLLNRNNKVRVLEPGHEYTGRSLGINEEGELLVEKEDGTVTAVYAGEVSVRGVYGYV